MSPRQHVGTGCPGMPAAGRSCVDEADNTSYRDCFLHHKVLKYLAGAQDISMLEQKQRAVMQLELAGVAVAAEDDTSTIDTFIYLFQETPFLQLCMRALANSMNVVLQDYRGSLLEHGTALDVVSALSHVIAAHLSQAFKMECQGRCQGTRERANSDIDISGLLPVLSRFTEAAWQALQQVELQERQQQSVQPKPATKSQHRQQQLRQTTLIDRCGTAAALIHKLLGLWRQILAQQHDNLSVGSSPFFAVAEMAMPALIALTTAAVSLLRKAQASVGSSSGGTTKVAAYDCLLRLIAAMGLPIAGALTMMNGVWSEQQVEQQEQQLQSRQQQHCLSTEMLPELLLQLLAHQAGELHMACGGVSLARQDSRAAAAAAAAVAAAAAAAHVSLQDHHQPPGQQQQQQQQQQLLEGFVVSSSHLSLLELLGLPHTDDFCPLDTGADITSLKSMYAQTLNALGSAVRARFWRAVHLSKTQQDAYQQQQEQKQQQPTVVDNSHIILPRRLLVPAIKMLIEVVLLVPVNDLMVHICSIRLILMLLHTSATPAAAAAPPAAAIAADAGAAVVEEASQVSTAGCPWPQLPAAIAAGLLLPVVGQLSQAVIYGLLQTEGLETDLMKAERLSLLHNYGSLLITVCQSVESKHVGSVLQSQASPDLLITLAAFEAVIRAQACHLALHVCHVCEQQQQHHHHHQQQQQQQQQSNTDPSTLGSCDVLSGILQHPLDEAPLLLLPFVSACLRALDSVLTGPYQQQHVRALLAGSSSSVVDKLSARLVTLLQTALKVSRYAMARAAAVQEEEQAGVIATAATGACKAAQATSSTALSQHERACRLTMANSLLTVMVAHSWFGCPHRLVSRMQTSDCSKVHAMQVGLLLRALHAWTCAWSSFAAAYEVPAATASSLQGIGCTQRVTPFSQILDAITAAFGTTKIVLEGLVPQAKESAVGLAGNGLLNQPQQCDDTDCEVHTLLQLRQVEASLEATMRLAVTEASTRSSSEAIADLDCLASKSYNELCDILKAVEVVCPSSALLTSMNRSVGMLRDLADTSMPCFPLPIICNNPMCLNLAKLSEWQLVCGSSCVCAGCGLARYCSKNCQVQHWKLHKPVCCRSRHCQ